MDKNEDSLRRERQKAIDGILHGGTSRRSLQGGPRPLPRQRFRGSAQATPSQAPIPGPQSPTPNIAPPRPTVQDPLSDLSGMDVMIDAVNPKPKSKRNAKRQRFEFFKHPIKTIKSWSWKKRILWLCIALAIIAALCLGYLSFKGYFSAKKVFKGGGSSVAIQEKVDPDMLKGEGSGRINILLLGVGGQGHEAPDLTDTILIMSIDPVNHKTALLSIPRDLWVQVPNHGSMKINAAYETGKYDYLKKQDSSNASTAGVEAGFTTADKAVEDVTGIPIHYHMLVNFQAFKQAIDTVGGISVDVPETLIDSTFTRENGGSAVIAQKGTQTFNGTKALMYVRSRHTSSDFARSQRQRAVIIALQQKIFTLGVMSNPSKISSLMDAFGNNVVTDLSLSNVSRLYAITKKISSDQIQSVGLTDEGHVLVTTGMISGQSVVYPLAGLNDYSQIQSYVRNTLKDGYLAKEDAKVLVLNGTNVAGTATTASDVLKSYGYNVVGAGDAPTKTYTKTTIVDLTKGKKPYTAHYLKDRYNVSKTVTKLPDSTINTQNADFVIILGEDETTNS